MPSSPRSICSSTARCSISARALLKRGRSTSLRLQAEAEARLAGQHAISELQIARSKLTAEQLGVRLEIEQERLGKLQASVAAQLTGQKARLAQLGQTALRRRSQADALLVRAGLDGVLQALVVESGQQLALGAQHRASRASGSLLAELAIPEIDAKDLAAGQRASIDTRNGVVAGHVERVEPAVSNGTVRVEIAPRGRLARRCTRGSVHRRHDRHRTAGGCPAGRATGQRPARVRVARISPALMTVVRSACQSDLAKHQWIGL